MVSSEVSMKGNRGGENFSFSGYSEPKETINVSVVGEGQKRHFNRPVSTEHAEIKGSEDTLMVEGEEMAVGADKPSAGGWGFCYYNWVLLCLWCGCSDPESHYMGRNLGHSRHSSYSDLLSKVNISEVHKVEIALFYIAVLAGFLHRFHVSFSQSTTCHSRTRKSIGPGRGKVYSGGETITFAGVDEAKEELEEIVEFLKSPERYVRLGARPPRGVLLVILHGTE